MEETHQTLEHLWKLWITRLAMQAELEIEPLYKHEERVNYRTKSLQGVSDVLSSHRQFKKGFDIRMDSRPLSSPPDLLDQVQQSLTGGLHASSSTEEVSMATPRQFTPENTSPANPGTAPQTLGSSSLTSISSPNSSFPTAPVVPANPSTNSHKYLLDASIANSKFLATFRLPTSESILHRLPARLWYLNTYIRGTLYVSAHFMCYHSTENSVKFVFPFHIVKCFSEPSAVPEQNGFGITVQTDTSTILLLFDPPTPILFWQKLKAISVCLDSTSNLAILNDSNAQLRIGFGDNAIFKKVTEVQFGPAYEAQQKKLEKKWWKYFNAHGIGAGLIQSRTALEELLAKGGIPDTMRGSAWKLLSGVTYKALADPMTYESVVQTVKIDERPAQADRVYVEHIIELDLRRSMPEHPYYQCNEGIDALRRVLTAYAYRNPLVSYCQGMNFIASSLLLYLSEADAFWTLAYLCEDVFPELWRPRLFGVRVVQEVMDIILAARLPAFIANCKDYPANLAMMSWIPTFLVGRVPLEYSLRMLDHIFLYGSDALYWMLFATFDLMVQDHGENLPADILLSFAAPSQAYLDTTTHPFERIFQHAFSKQTRTETIPSELLARLATETKMKLVRELLSKARKSKIESLSNLTLHTFIRDDMETLYTKYHAIIQREDAGLMSFSTFSAHYIPFFSMWHPTIKLFRVFQASMNTYLGNRALKVSADSEASPRLHMGSSLLLSSSTQDLLLPTTTSPASSSSVDNSATVVEATTSTSVPLSSISSLEAPSHPSDSSSSMPGSVSRSPSTSILLPTTSTLHTSNTATVTTPLNWHFIRDLFNIFDTNHDGYLNIEEWILGLYHLFRSPGPSALKICLQLVDEDHDGVVSHVAHRCALGLFLLLHSTKNDADQLEVPQTCVKEKLSEWMSIVEARAASQSRSDTIIDDIIAVSFGDVLNIFTFFNISPTTPWHNLSKVFSKLAS